MEMEPSAPTRVRAARPRPRRAKGGGKATGSSGWPQQFEGKGRLTRVFGDLQQAVA